MNSRHIIISLLQLRNTVFNVGNKDGIGMDLASVDIARGRDHGLSPYHIYLNMSIPGGFTVDSWDDLIGIFSNKVSMCSFQVACTLFNL